MDDDDERAGSHGTLRWAIQTAGFACLVGLIAIQYFANADRNAVDPVRLAHAGTARTTLDPETTGSIAKGASTLRLDPCRPPSAGEAFHR